MAGLKPYFLHLRPLSWGIVSLHFLVGALSTATPESILSNSLFLLLGLVVWTMFLNGGTLALNSAVDRDRGDIGYLDHPPPVPGVLFTLAGLWLTSGLLLSLLLPPGFIILYGLCFLMSVLYSVPPVRLKARAGWDTLINCLGYGAFTFLAGAATTVSLVSSKALLLALGFALLFGAFYPLTQLYQVHSDRVQKVTTLTVRLGPRGALWFSLLFALYACAVFLLAAFIFSRLLLPLYALAFVGWFWLITRSLKAPEPRIAKPVMYHALWLWAVVDLATLGFLL